MSDDATRRAIDASLRARIAPAKEDLDRQAMRKVEDILRRWHADASFTDATALALIRKAVES